MVDSVVAEPAFRPAIVDRSTLAGRMSERRGFSHNNSSGSPADDPIRRTHFAASHPAAHRRRTNLVRRRPWNRTHRARLGKSVWSYSQPSPWADSPMPLITALAFCP